MIEVLTDIGYIVNKRLRLGEALTQFPISVTPRDVGRPPLNRDEETKPTMVRLTADIRKRITVLVGPHRMAVFIRDAVERELSRREAEGEGS